MLRKITAYAVRILMRSILSSILPRKYFLWKIIRNASSYVSENTKRVGSFTSMGRYGFVMDKSKFENFVYADFEGRKRKIPSGYDEWLTKEYGDYMTPPPEDKRKTHHYFEALIKEEGE